MSTARWQMPEIFEGQSKAEVTHNEALVIIDALLHGRVLDRNLTAPPASPVNGNCYIVASSGASGAWTGHENDIATYYNGWLFVEPLEGTVLLVDDEDGFAYYTGSAWTMVTIATLTQSISASYVQAEIQAIQTKVNDIITALKSMRVVKNA